MKCIRDIRLTNRQEFALFLGVLLLLALSLYWDFFTAQKYLVFVGVGSDSFAQYVPFFRNEAGNIAQLDFSAWNFSQFLGAPTPDEISPEYFASLLGKEAVPYMMFVLQFCKILLSGVFFYLYLGYAHVSYGSRFAVSLGYAACGRMCALCAWGGYTMEIALFAAMLWSYERFLTDRRHVFGLPISFALMILIRGIYGIALYSIVMLGYTLFRMLYDEESFPSARFCASFFARLLGLYVAGLALASPVMLPTLETYAQSARVTSALSSVGSSSAPVLTSAPVLAEMVLKLFSTGIFGTMEGYTGYAGDVLGAPYFYCGILPLLGVPFALAGKTRRQKAAIVMALALSFSYALFPSFRDVINGFSVSVNDFRMSSLWIVFVIAGLGALGLDKLWNGAHSGFLVAWTAVLLCSYGVCCLYLRPGIHLLHATLPAALLLFYVAVLLFSNAKPSRWTFLIVLLAVPLELFAQEYSTVNRVQSVTPESYEQTYNSVLEDRLGELSDGIDGPYRVDYPSILLARPMAHNYYGTQAYIGGTGISIQQENFLRAMGNDYVETLGYSRYAYGFNSVALNNLLGVRFLVYGGEGNYLVPVGYHKVSDPSEYFQIFENDYALPFFFGYASSDVIGETEFESVPREYRDEQMLMTAVVQDDQSPMGVKNDWSQVGAMLSDSSSSALVGQPATINIPKDAGDKILVNAQLSGVSRESGDIEFKLVLIDDDPSTPDETVFYLTAGGNERIQIPVENKGYTSARFEIVYTNLFDDARIGHLSVTTQPEWMESFLSAQYEDRMSYHPTVTRHTGSEIEGTIDMPSEGYLVTSVPWNDNWAVYIDGERVDTTLVNLGFVGARIEGGHHAVRLVYEDRGQMIGTGLFCASALVLAGISWQMRKRGNAGPARHAT